MRACSVYRFPVRSLAVPRLSAPSNANIPLLFRNIPLASKCNNILIPSLFSRSFAATATAKPKLSSGRFTRIARKQRRRLLSLALFLLLGAGAYNLSEPFRHFVIAIKRCSVIGWAVTLNVLDYKYLFWRSWPGEDEGETERGIAARKQRHEDYSNTHTRCAERVLRALQQNAGVYVKLGQHISSIQLIPTEWATTMRPLQDQCNPTPLPDISELFLSDVGRSIDDLFSTFDPKPIGVASLAQVHIATDRATGKKVAVKIMHPELEEFAAVDMKTTTFSLKIIKTIFPAFEFEWLGQEMEENLPLEMDFVHEAANAERCRKDFKDLPETTCVIPEVLWAKKRVLVMEFIEGGRVDNLEYLAQHNIDKNKVSQELARIFSQMLYLNGFFHADPHAGNLLIRPAQPATRSPYNFEIVLLDHGLYFDLSDHIRTNYARLWLSLISPSTKKTEADRRKYAKLVGNIDEDMYLIFQSAITGRASLAPKDEDGERAPETFSLMDMKPQTADETKRIRNTIVEDDFILSIFDLLRRVPKRLLMILKLNDLTRSLDQALQTNHGVRVWLIVAHYCAFAAWLDDIHTLRTRYKTQGFSLRLFGTAVKDWFNWQKWQYSFWFYGKYLDLRVALGRAVPL